ncbi:MAG: hypothetical protein EOP94_05475, partial [Zymomonas sp.]
MKILALGTYPTRRPVHGGQRRTWQIGAYYQRHGAEYRYACVHTDTYGTTDVTAFDYPYASAGGLYSAIPFIDDLGSGVFAASQDGPYRHFRTLVEAYEPDVIQLEQPFMWPLVKRMRTEGVLGKARLVYSSHNFEAPLKRAILEGAGVDRTRVAEVDSLLRTTEQE